MTNSETVTAGAEHDDDTEILTVKQFCARHGIGRTTFYAEVAAKKLVACKVRGRTGVTKEDAAAWRRALPRLETADAAA